MDVGGGLGGNQGVAAALRARLNGDVAPPAAAGKFEACLVVHGMYAQFLQSLCFTVHRCAMCILRT